ncbi:hypothetical protein DSECCO2_660250 [anaerobic digester metagenome]
MEGAGIERAGCNGIGNFGYLVSIVSIVSEVIYQSEAGVGLSLALQGEDIARFVVGNQLVVAVWVGGKGSTFAVTGSGKPVKAVIGELVSSFHGFISRLPFHGADVAVESGFSGCYIVYGGIVGEGLVEFCAGNLGDPIAHIIKICGLFTCSCFG